MTHVIFDNEPWCFQCERDNGGIIRNIVERSTSHSTFNVLSWNCGNYDNCSGIDCSITAQRIRDSGD